MLTNKATVGLIQWRWVIDGCTCSVTNIETCINEGTRYHTVIQSSFYVINLFLLYANALHCVCTQLVDLCFIMVLVVSHVWNITSVLLL